MAYASAPLVLPAAPGPSVHHQPSGLDASLRLSAGRLFGSTAACRVTSTCLGVAAACALGRRLFQKRRHTLCHQRVFVARTSTAAGTSEDVDAILAVALKAADAAGELIRKKVGAEVLQTKAFAADLLTEVDTECEAAIRTIVANAFPEHSFLGEESSGTAENVAAEASSGERRWLWVVDPIDGTTNFAAGMPLSAVSIGVAYGGEVQIGVICDPFRGEMFEAVRGRGAKLNGETCTVSTAARLADAVVASGAPPNPRSAAPCFRAMTQLAPPTSRTIRILGSAAINFAWVACGRLDAWFEPDLNPWDNAAGALLVQEAGGIVTDGEGVNYNLAMRPICASNGRFHAELETALQAADATRLDEQA